MFVGAVGVLISDRQDDDDGDGNVKDSADRNDIANIVAMKNVKADAIILASSRSTNPLGYAVADSNMIM